MKRLVAGTHGHYVASKHAVVATFRKRLITVSLVGRVDDADFALIDEAADALASRKALLCLYDCGDFDGAAPRLVERAYHWATRSTQARTLSVNAQAIVLPRDRLTAALAKGMADSVPSPFPQTLHETVTGALRELGEPNAPELAKAVRELRKVCVPPVLKGRPLTEREKQIASYVVSGASDLNIAANLELAESTIGSHLERIFQKTGVHSRAELAQWFKTTTK